MQQLKSRRCPGQTLVTPATSNQQPATSNQQPATSNQQPATNHHQPATSNQNWIGALLGFGLLLCLFPSTAVAQTGDSSTPPASAGKPAAQEELPAIFLIEHRPSSTPSRRDDSNFFVQSALQAILLDSGKYTVYTYSPFLTILKQGILNHNLEASDLDEPLTPAAMHRIAALVGARSILVFYTTPEKGGLRTDVNYEQLAAQQTWRTAVTNQFYTGSNVGKRKLKLEEIAKLNADTIAKSLGIPSHLIDDLHLEVALKPIPAPNTKPKKDHNTVAQNPDIGTVPVNPDTQTQDPTTAGSTTQGTNTGTPTNTSPIKGTKVTKGTTATTSKTTPPGPGTATSPGTATDTGTTATVDPNQPTVPEHIEDFPEVVGKPKKGKGAPKRDSITSFPQTGGGIDSPGQPIAGQVIGEQSISNADRALRFKQSGDPINQILYLRRAIDDTPNDVNLRRQLILAYQENQMPERAVAEINRALLLDPKNGTLHRLQGDSLYSLGNTSEALKAYQEAIRLDPNDVAAQIALGDIQLHNGQLEDALKTYRDAAAGAPKSALPHRRMARVALQRAYADPSQYAVSVEEIKKARSLSLPNDTATYLSDYALLLNILQSRLQDLLEQMDSTYDTYQKGNANKEATIRQVTDLKERAVAAADYLDVLPSATGQEGTQALYQEGAVSIITTLGYFKSFVEKKDTQFEDKMNSEKLNARHDLSTAGQRLQASLPGAKTDTGERPAP